MLKQRLLTALVAMPIIVALVVFAPRSAIGLVLAAIVLAGAWEWSALVRLTTPAGKTVYLLGLTVLLAACGLSFDLSGVAGAVAAVGVAWWLAAIVWLLRVESGTATQAPPWLVGLCGVVTLVPAWEAVMALRGTDAGAAKLLFLLILIWAADSGAYASGRLWGRHRLAPRISPGKTWEGVAGGLVAAALAGAGGGWYFGYALAAFVPLCLFVAALSIVGDLTESLFKRRAGIKDSGSIFPGHGGILDRFDSLSAAGPAFYLGLWMLGAWL